MAFTTPAHTPTYSNLKSGASSHYAGSTYSGVSSRYNTPVSPSHRSQRRSRRGVTSAKRSRTSLAGIYFRPGDDDDDDDGRGGGRRGRSRSPRRSSPRRRGRSPSRSSVRSSRSGGGGGGSGSPDSVHSARSNRSTRSTRSRRNDGGNDGRHGRASSRGRRNLGTLDGPSGLPSGQGRDSYYENNDFDDAPPIQSLSSQTDVDAVGGWTMDVGDPHVDRTASNRRTHMMAPDYTTSREGRSARRRPTTRSTSRGGHQRHAPHNRRHRSISDASQSSYGSPRGGSEGKSPSDPPLLSLEQGGGGIGGDIGGGIVAYDEDEIDEMQGDGRWLTMYGFDVKKYTNSVLDYLSKADWTELAEFLNERLPNRMAAGSEVTADKANRSDMIEYLGSSRPHADANSERMMRRMLKDMFDLDPSEIDFILSGNHYDDFQRLYLKISDLDRLMILDHHVLQGNSMDIQFATREQAQSVLMLDGEEINLPGRRTNERTRMLIGVKRTRDVAKQQRRVAELPTRRLHRIPRNRSGVRLRTDAHSGIPDGAKRRKRVSTRAPEYMVMDQVSIMKHPERQMSCCEMFQKFFTNGW